MRAVTAAQGASSITPGATVPGAGRPGATPVPAGQDLAVRGRYGQAADPGAQEEEDDASGQLGHNPGVPARLAAAVWIGGQVTLTALVPVLRRLGAQVPRAAARRFNQIAWPAFAILVITGIGNIIAV